MTYKTFICTQCDHEVVATETPHLEWDDGHRCTFIQKVEVRSYEAAIPDRETYLEIRSDLRWQGSEFYQDIVWKNHSGEKVAHRYIKAKGMDYETAWNLYYRITAMIGTQGVRIYHPHFEPYHFKRDDWAISITLPEHVVIPNPRKGKIGDTW